MTDVDPVIRANKKPDVLLFQLIDTKFKASCRVQDFKAATQAQAPQALLLTHSAGFHLQVTFEQLALLLR